MSVQTITSSIESRIAEARRELSILEAVLGVMKASGEKVKGKPGPRANLEAPEGLFNVLRPEVLKCLSSRPVSVHDVIDRLAKKNGVTVNKAARKVMWARIWQHLLQLESNKEAKRTDKGWVKVGPK